LGVFGAYRDEALGEERRRCYPHQAGRVVRDLFSLGCEYVLVESHPKENT
jgi:hypothetical protein